MRAGQPAGRFSSVTRLPLFSFSQRETEPEGWMRCLYFDSYARTKPRARSPHPALRATFSPWEKGRSLIARVSQWLGDKAVAGLRSDRSGPDLIRANESLISSGAPSPCPSPHRGEGTNTLLPRLYRPLSPAGRGLGVRGIGESELLLLSIKSGGRLNIEQR